MRQHDGHRHKFFRFVAGETEHHTLIPRAGFVDNIAIEFLRVVDAHCDVGRLLVNRGENRTGVVVESQVAAVVTDVFDDVARDFRDVGIAIRRDFAHYEHDARRRANFARNVSPGIFCKNIVKDSVRDLVANLIGMSFGNTF